MEKRSRNTLIRFRGHVNINNLFNDSSCVLEGCKRYQLISIVYRQSTCSRAYCTGFEGTLTSITYSVIASVSLRAVNAIS